MNLNQQFQKNKDLQALFKHKNPNGATNQPIKQTTTFQQSEGEEEDNSDVFAFLNKNSQINVKQENKNSTPLNKYIQDLNSKINDAKSKQKDVKTEQNNDRINSNIAQKMTKQEELLYQEQEDYLKKKQKKSLSGNINPVLMKLQNKQITQTQQNLGEQIKQQNVVIETKMEQESSNSQKVSVIQEQQQNENNKIIQKQMEIEYSIQIFNQNTNKSSKARNESIPEQEQNNQSVFQAKSNKTDQSSDNQPIINKIQGKLCNEGYNSQKSSILSKLKTVKTNNQVNITNQKNNSLLNNNKEMEQEYESEDDEEDIEILKYISAQNQKSQNTNQNQKQSTKKNQPQEQYSILPVICSFDESNVNSPNDVQNNDSNKSNSNNNDNNNQNFESKISYEPNHNNDFNNGNLNNQNTDNSKVNLTDDKKSSQQLNKNQIDFNFDAILEINNDESEDEETEQNNLKGTQNDISMNIQINQQNDDDFEESIPLNIKSITQKLSSQQVQSKQNNNFNAGMSKGLKDLLKKNQQTIPKNNNDKINQQNQVSHLQEEKSQQNNQTNYMPSKQQITQNPQLENKSKIQSLMNMHSQKQNQQQNLSNIQNKPTNPEVRINDNSQNSDNDDDDDDEKMKQLFSKENDNKLQSNNVIPSKLQDTNTKNINNNQLTANFNQNNQNKNHVFKTPVQNSKQNNYQTKITQYTPNSENSESEDYLYQNFENNYQNLMMNRGNQRGGKALFGDESINLSKQNIKGNNQGYTTAKKQTKKQIPQLTPYKLNLQLYQKKKKMKQSVEEYKMYNLTSQQFEVKLADNSFPKELKDYNIKQINRGTFNNKKIPRLTVIMVEFEILHQIIKATLLDFSGSLSGSFSKGLFQDDSGDSQGMIIKKEEDIDDDINGEEDKENNDEDYVNRKHDMDIEGKENMNKRDSQKEKKKKIDFSTVYTINHEKGTQISLKLNTLLVLKDYLFTVWQQNASTVINMLFTTNFMIPLLLISFIFINILLNDNINNIQVTVIQQNEEPPFLNISEKNIVQVVYPF